LRSSWLTVGRTINSFVRPGARWCSAWAGGTFRAERIPIKIVSAGRALRKKPTEGSLPNGETGPAVRLLRNEPVSRMPSGTALKNA